MPRGQFPDGPFDLLPGLLGDEPIDRPVDLARWLRYERIAILDMVTQLFVEVARRLGISTSAAKVRAHRAYRALREILAGAGPPAAG